MNKVQFYMIFALLFLIVWTALYKFARPSFLSIILMLVIVVVGFTFIKVFFPK